MSEWTGRRDACPFCKGSGHRVHIAPLTKHQAILYGYLVAFTEKCGYAPSFDEIAKEFGYSSLATVHEHLENLDRKGYIARSYNEARSIICLVDLSELGTATPSETEAA